MYTLAKISHTYLLASHAHAHTYWQIKTKILIQINKFAQHVYAMNFSAMIYQISKIAHIGHSHAQNDETTVKQIRC